MAQGTFTVAILWTLVALGRSGVVTKGVRCNQHKQIEVTALKPPSEPKKNVMNMGFSYCESEQGSEAMGALSRRCRRHTRQHMIEAGMSDPSDDAAWDTARKSIHARSTIYECLWRVCMKVFLPSGSVCKTRSKPTFAPYPHTQGDHQIVNSFHNRMTELKHKQQRRH